MDAYKAQRETEWALAVAGDPAVQSLLLVVDKEVLRMAWMLGWQQGMLTARTEQLREMDAKRRAA